MNRWLTVAEGADHSGQDNAVVGRRLPETSDADLHELLTIDDVAALLKVTRS